MDARRIVAERAAKIGARAVTAIVLALAIALGARQKAHDNENWILAMIKSNGRVVGTIFVNTKASSELKGETTYISFQLSYKGNPMPSDSDMGRFDQFDDALTNALKSAEGVNVAVKMVEGKRTWSCYAPSRTVVGSLRNKLRKFWPSISVESDPLWSHYWELRKSVSG
jgi:hypothetical protein